MATHKITLFVSGTDDGAMDLAQQVRDAANAAHTECAIMGMKVKPIALPLLTERAETANV